MRPRLFSDEEILAVARETFLERGPHVSTTVIAERVGVSQATLFKRFGSKEVLLHRALQPREGWTILQKLCDGPDERPMRVQLTELLREMAVFFDKMAPSLAALRATGASPPRFEGEGPSPPILGRLQLTRWLGEAQERGELSPGVDPAHLAVALIAISQARAMRRHLVEDTELKDDDDAYIVAVMDMLFEGVAP